VIACIGHSCLGRFRRARALPRVNTARGPIRALEFSARSEEQDEANCDKAACWRSVPHSASTHCGGSRLPAATARSVTGTARRRSTEASP
jgi:hypothetical protein